MKIKIGTRRSQLATSQAKIVKDLITEQMSTKVEIVHIKSLGDIDRVSPLHTFRGKGVFTSSLEKALLGGKIDVAVHSLKDLPVEDQEGLEIRAYIRRHDPSDTLLIKESNLLSEKPLSIKSGSVIATGSIRRQSQILNQCSGISIVNIRGNVDTRISKLESDQFDGLVVASAIFERINVKIPDNIKRIQLPLDLFPCAPGQGAIAVQCRENDWNELNFLNDKVTEQEVKLERSVLHQLVGNCDLGLGLYAKSHNSLWNIYGTLVPKDWWPGSNLKANRIYFKGSLNDFQNSYRFYFDATKNIEYNGSLANRKVIIARAQGDAEPYSSLLEKYGAMVFHLPLLDYKTHYEKLDNPRTKELWKNAKWILLTSKRAVEFLGLLVKKMPRTDFKIGVVGNSTANEVRKKGLPVNVIAKGTVNNLEYLLQNTDDINPNTVLYLSGENITKIPLKGCQRLVVYNATKRDLEFPFKVDDLIIFSKRSANHVLSQLGPEITNNWIAIGPTTGAFLKEKNLKVITSKNPNPEGVLKAILGEE